MNTINYTFKNLTINSGFNQPKINIRDLYCNQLNSFFIRTGIIIVCVYIFFSWFNWWFFNKGYKLIPDKDINYIGNLHNLETRIYWDIFIKDKLSKFMLGYIVVVIYFNL